MEAEDIKTIEEAVDDFLADSRTLRFEDTAANRNLLFRFIEEHDLEVSHRTLLFAFDSLQSELDLTPFREPIPAPPQPQAEPTPTPTVQPPPVVARARTFVAFRNGAPISGSVRSL
jgi:hypothetical protein